MIRSSWGDFLSVPELVEHLHSNETMFYRQRAAYLLGQRGDVSAVEALVQALGDGSQDVRKVAAGALATLGTIAIPELVRLFQVERSPDRRALWLEQIATITDQSRHPRPTNAECLYHALRDPAIQVRYVAFRIAQRQVWQQALLNNFTDADAVLLAGASDPSFIVRQAALEGFQQARPDPARVTSLLSAMQDKDADVRKSAKQLLRIPDWRAAVQAQDAAAVWLLAEDATTLLEALLDPALSARRWARVGLACAWQILELFVSKRSGKHMQSLHVPARQALEVAERCLDETATAAELEQARQTLRECRSTLPTRGQLRIIHLSDGVMQATLACLPATESAPIAEAVRSSVSSLSQAIAGYCESPLFGTIRDIVGNPFRPIALNPSWLTSTVVDLAKAIHDERAFDRIPILADALMDAGCDSDEIIQHCRGDGPHARGCWVVDLLLGKP